MKFKGFFQRLETNFQQLRLKEEQKSTRITPEQRLKAQEFFGSDKNLEQRNALIREAMQHGYYDNAKQILRVGAKLWEAPTRMKLLQQSPRLPLFGAKFHNTNNTLQDVITKNKCTLVAFQFNQLGEQHVATFIEPFLKEFQQMDKIDVVQVNVVEQAVKSPIMKLLSPYLRYKQGNAIKRYLNIHANIYDEKQQLGISNSALGWVFLSDSNGYLRWFAHGIATPGELETLKRLTLKIASQSHIK